MNLNTKYELLLPLIISSESSSDEDEICEVLAMLEEDLLPKRRMLLGSKRPKKRLQPERNSSEESLNLKKDFEPGANDSITVQKNNTDVRTELDDISENLLLSYLNKWKQMKDSEFSKIFRLPKLCYERLLEKFGAFQGRYKLLPTDERSRILLIFLLFAGHQITIKRLTQKISIYRSKLIFYVNSVVEFLVSLKSTFVCLPHSLEEKQRIAEDFFNVSNLKNIIGCIEKINFYCRARCGNTSNDNNMSSFPVEIICDAHGRFLANESEIPDSKLAKECEGNYCFLASYNYSLREWTITPCQEDENQEPPTLDVDQQLFNKRFRSTYKVLPKSIYQLQQCFPQLKCIDTNRTLFARNFLLACTVMYNFALDCNDGWREEFTLDCHEYLDIDPMLGTVEKSEYERFKCPKGIVKRDRMIYDSCNLDSMNIIEQEIEVE